MNPIDPTAHQASSPPLFNTSSSFFPYQSQMPQNMMNGLPKIPGLASLDEEQRSRSITPFVNQSLARRANYAGQMAPSLGEIQPSTTMQAMPPSSATYTMPPPSATYTMPSQDPRLPKQESSTPVRTLQERIAEFEYDIQSKSTGSRPAANAFLGSRSVEGSNADRRHTIHGDARRSANTMTGNDVHHQPEQNPPVAGTKRSRSPENENHDNDSGSDSADGIMDRPAKRQASRQARRRRLNNNLYEPTQPTHGESSPQAESEDGDSLFVPAQSRQLKAESLGSPESDAPNTTSNTTPKSSAARELKQRLAGKSGKAFSRKLNPEKDPENISIKHMRCVERKQFDDIADELNRARVAAGLEPTFTANAVYGRFQRIAPRIAALEGQPDFNYRDYLHIPREVKLVVEKSVSLPAMTPQQETLFVEAYERVKREVWVYTAARFREMGGFELSPEQAALKFKSI
ncbi:hypothetical protein IWZ00DRAFT_575695 [Phyllosticta capitalensis]